LSIKKKFRLNSREKDQIAERNRYDLRAARELNNVIDANAPLDHLLVLNEIHKRPYLDYYALLREKASNSLDLLELGCGTGLHSSILVESGARVTLLDISSKSLEVCRIRFGERAQYLCGDMSSIKLPDNSFDLIVANGSLSYANHKNTIAEMHRLLRPGGTIIIMDSLNHNPIFILNRLIRYLRGERTFSTLLRIPRIGTLRRISNRFEYTQRWSYGGYVWLVPILESFVGLDKCYRIIARIESKKSFSRYRFKFLLICGDFKK
jgi:ubiquinone/menaquinone biosynthesis C-methylase UbiE